MTIIINEVKTINQKIDGKLFDTGAHFIFDENSRNILLDELPSQATEQKLKEILGQNKLTTSTLVLSIKTVLLNPERICKLKRKTTDQPNKANAP